MSIFSEDRSAEGDEERAAEDERAAKREDDLVPNERFMVVQRSSKKEA